VTGRGAVWRSVIGAAAVGGFACAPAPGPDPAVAELSARRAAVEPLRHQLHALERELVLGQLQAARATGDPAALREVVGVAVQLGLVEAPPPSPPAVDARVEGVTRAQGVAVLDGVRAEYVDPIEEGAWGGAAAEALGVAAGGSPEAAIDAAIAAGRASDEAVVVGVEAALASLDAHTRPVWPSQLGRWSQRHAGVQVGVGVTLHEPTRGMVEVRTLAPAGPAWSAGVRQGDQVLAIDGAEVAGLDDARRGLAGPEGEEVLLRLGRGGDTLEVSLVRAAVPEETARGWRRRPDHRFDPEVAESVAYLRVTAVRPDTDDQLLALAGDAAWEGVILDLRGNAGGDVQASVHLVDAWLDEGVVAQMVGRAAPRPPPPEAGVLAWNETRPGGPFVGVPTVVLVDRQTASAAEIVAGALQQLAGAHVVGEPTHGKGSSQALRADADLGVAWQVTNLAWALPDGRVLAHGQGVQPDDVWTMSPAERWQLRRLALQREHPVVHADGSEMRWSGPAVRPELPALPFDPLIVEALLWLRQERARSTAAR